VYAKIFGSPIYHAAFWQPMNSRKITKTHLIIVPALSLVLAACSHDPVIGEYQRDLQRQGFVGYNQPIGDPKNPSDWNKLGPGTILRTGKTQDYYYPAKTLVGDAGVQAAIDPKNASPISLFTEKRVSGYDLDGKGGWTLDAVNQISGSLNLKDTTNVDVQFGNAWKANPKGEGEWHQLLSSAKDLDSTCRRGLRKGQFAVVQNVVWTDSIRYYFKQNKAGGGSVVYKLSVQDIANLNAKGYKVIDGGVQVDHPRFIAFTPLPAVANDVDGRR